MFHAPGIGHSDLHELFSDPCDKVHFFALIQASYWRWLGIVLPIERGGPPHEAFRYVIHYLELRELLALEMTSKDLLETIRREAPHWQRLRVDPALSLKLTDTALWSLARRARGRLESLELANCQRISDEPLKRILTENRLISKLDLACCKGVSIQAVMEIVNLHTQPGFQRLRRLRIEGVSGIAMNHIEKLRATLCSSSSKPSRYCYREEERRSQEKRSANNEEERDIRALDVEACPKCALPRVVYDCSRVQCQEKQRSQSIEEQCRACSSCIRRCDRCGGCLENDEYEETFSLEVMCLDCWKLCNCQVCGKHDTSIPAGYGQSSLPPDRSEVFSLEEIWRREIEQRQRQVNAMIVKSYVETLRSSFLDGRVSSPVDQTWRLDDERQHRQQQQSVNCMVKSCIATPTPTAPKAMPHSLLDRRIPLEEMWRLEVKQQHQQQQINAMVANYMATAKTLGSSVLGQRVAPEEIWRLEVEQQRRRQQINSMLRNYTATPTSKTMTPILS